VRKKKKLIWQYACALKKQQRLWGVQSTRSSPNNTNLRERATSPSIETKESKRPSEQGYQFKKDSRKTKGEGKEEIKKIGG